MMRSNIRMTREEARRRRCAGPFMVMGHCCVVLLLASCASGGKEKKTTDYSDLKLGTRIVKQTKDPYSIKSPFQKEVYNASKTVKTSKFKSSEYHASKKF